ncbi:MAG TPA: hypothetical protein VMS17_03290 [Gemmataceae bacterium]|nr:hypothetical protein [Gemmataceae bacterium]
MTLIEGPLGFPMPDKSARAVDALLRTLPKTKDYEYRKTLVSRPPTELNPGERSDVSWISTESVDRMGEVVTAGGMDDGQFRQNPLVTLGHVYWMPPVGKSLWRKRVKDGDLVGIKAKTVYPPRPESWPAGDDWPPDKVLALVQAGLLQGKSIGFLPTKVHVPDAKESAERGWTDGVSLVIDEWLLLEYACVFLPANQDALVEAVSKGAVALDAALLRALGLDAAFLPPPLEGEGRPSLPSPLGGEGSGVWGTDRPTPFTPLAEVERAAARAVEAVDWPAFTARRVADRIDRLRGRV